MSLEFENWYGEKKKRSRFFPAGKKTHFLFFISPAKSRFLFSTHQGPVLNQLNSMAEKNAGASKGGSKRR